MRSKYISGLARHPLAPWPASYRDFIRRAMSCQVFMQFGSCERFSEIVDEWMTREELGTKTYLFETSLDSQRRIDAICRGGAP